MSDAVWKKISYLVGLLPLGALFGLVAYVANIEIKDLDLWLHIATGRYIVTNHVIPQVDVLSCSFAGAPWINHEWLFQVIVYWIYNAFGPDGLIKMQIIIVTLTMLLLLFLGYSKDKQLTTTFVLMLVFCVFQTRFTIRPEIYSLFFFAVYIFILALHIDKRWAPGILFIVQVLWSNIHGFFFFGPLFILIALVSEWMKRHVKLPYEWNEAGRLTDEEYGRLKGILFGVVAACFLNPYFARGAWYPLGVFFSFSGKNKIFFDYIEELQKPITWHTLFDLQSFIFYKILIFISLASFIFNRRRIDVSALLFWLVFLVFSIQAARNIAFFAFAAYLVFVTNAMSLSYRSVVPLRFTGKKFQYLTEIVAKILLLLWMMSYSQLISGRSYYDFQKYEAKSEFGGVSLRSYPTRAADFLTASHVKGNFFNDFNSGAYLLGRCFPNIKVFIDGRTEVYGGAFFEEYQKIWESADEKTIGRMFNRYAVTGALLSSARQHIPPALLKYFYTHKEWALVYFDYDAVVFLKYTPGNKPIIDRYLVDLPKRKTMKENLKKLGPERDYPYQYYYRAYTLESLELNDQALEEAREAVTIAPDYPDVYQLMGKIYAKKANYEKAFEQFRVAVTLSPQNMEMRYNLAQSYFDLNAFDEAVKQYEMIMSLRPASAKTYFLLAKTYARMKKYEEAWRNLKNAHTLDPRDVYDILNIGDVILENKEYEKAVECYKFAFETKRNPGNVHEKLGIVYQEMGALDQAKKEFQAALTIEPDNKSVKEKLDKLNVSLSNKTK